MKKHGVWDSLQTIHEQGNGEQKRTKLGCEMVAEAQGGGYTVVPYIVLSTITAFGIFTNKTFVK